MSKRKGFRWVFAVLAAAAMIACLSVGAYADAEPVEVDSWDDLKPKVDLGTPFIKLTADVSGDDMLQIWYEIVLDLNGHRLIFSDLYERPAISIEEGELTIVDNSAEGGGLIDCGSCSKGIMNNRSLILQSGCIDGTSAQEAAVLVNGYGTFTMTGGSVTADNTAVFVNGYGTFTMTGGSVTADDTAVFVDEDGEFHLSGAPKLDKVVLSEECKIAGCGGANGLSPDTVIPVSTVNRPLPSRPVVFTENFDLFGGALENFVSADPAYAVRSENDRAQLVMLFDVTVTDERITAEPAKAAAGDDVTLTAQPGYTLASLTVMQGNDPVTVVGDQFVMPAGDVTVSATFTYADNLGAHLGGYTLSLDGDIGVNFYMELTDEIAQSGTAYMNFTLPGGTQKVYVEQQEDETLPYATTAVQGGKTYYVFKCRVAAKGMTDVIEARLVDGEKAGTLYQYSVKQYAGYLLANAENNAAYAKAAPLVRAMLNYGASAQAFFDYNTENPANADLTEAEQAVPDVSVTAPKWTETLPAGVTFDGTTLSLKSETTLSLYFTSEQTLTFSCEGYGVKKETAGDYQIPRIRGIKAKDIGKTFALSVTAGENSGTVTYSPLNYCANVLGDSEQNESLQNVVRALAIYWQRAQAYADPPQEKTFLFTNNRCWETAYLYATDALGIELTGEYPGTQITETVTNGYGETQFVIHVPAGAVSVVISDGQNSRTVAITNFDYGYSMNGEQNEEGHYIVEEFEQGEIPDPPQEKTFLLIDNFGWGTAYLYAEDEDGNQLASTFPGTRITETVTNDDGETQFVIHVPAGAFSIVISNGRGERTEDIKDFDHAGYWMDGTTDMDGHYVVTPFYGD